MSLTGIPLLVLAGVVTGGAIVGTIASWHRFGRYRILTRTFGVLLAEALVMATIGLAVNRSQLFYPSWSALWARDTTTDAVNTAHPARLDAWLQSFAGAHPDRMTAVPWRPAGWRDWRLAADPTLVVPAGYLSHPTWRYPVVVVATDRLTSQTDAAELAAARSAESAAGPSVVVFAPLSPATPASTMATAIPRAVAYDLRVTPYRWALVVSAAERSLAHQVVLAEPGRYHALAIRQTASQPSGAIVTAGIADLPTGIAIAIVRPRGGAAADHPIAHLTVLNSPASNTLPTALLWTVQQTPSPLAASQPLLPPGAAPRPSPCPPPR